MTHVDMPPTLEYDDSFMVLFWAKVDRSGGPEACWPWIGARSSHGYGNLNRSRWKRPRGAHRVSLEVKLGRPLGPGEFALHSCDNPPCVNPAHLSAGTVKQNAREAADRGRTLVMRGTDAPRARLTDEDVREIRRLRAEGRTTTDIAARFGLHHARVSMIARGLQWKHVDGERAPADSRRGTRFTPEQVAEIKVLHEAGQSYRSIAARLGCDPATVMSVFRGPRLRGPKRR